MFQLRPYQETLKKNLYSSWDAGSKATIGVLSTGAGKTAIMSSIATDVNDPMCIIAHRQELVQQISIALARMGLRHNIVAADKTIKVIISQHIKEFGQSFYERRSHLTVAGVNTLIARKKELTQWANTIRFWMIDECFPAGTMIDGRPIETIKVGDFVRAYDDQSGEIRLSRVTRTFKNPAPDEMIDIKSGHHVIKVTKGHPIYTQRGWVCAGEIKTSDRILVDTLYELRKGGRANNRSTEIRVSEARPNILQSEMWLSTQGSKQSSKGQASRRNHVLGMLKQSTRTVPNCTTIREKRTSLLLKDLLSGIQASDFIENNGGDKQEIRQCPNDREQSNEIGRSSKEGIGRSEVNLTSTQDTGWKRATPDQSGNQVARHVWDHGVRGATCRRDEITGIGIADTLQDRLCEPTTEDSNRSRWTKSRQSTEARTGPKEGSVFAWQGVDSVSVHKRSNTDKLDDGYVYNIEVDEYHTYVAEGIVVHNCHHVLSDNMWGKATQMFPHARGLGFTASPIRCDRKSLHAAQGGVFHDMCVGPSMRDLITDGYLCDYRIFGPPQSINVSDLTVSKTTGDYTNPSLREAAKQSTITGDIVEHYLKIAAGKRGITFTVDVDSAVRTAELFRQAGVPAEAVSAKTPDAVRNAVIDKFRNGSILQLVNVDLFGEGFDVPAVEVVSMGRPTQSLGLYMQQFGRALRTMDGKERGIVIDHVGNMKQHGLPDAVRGWKLEAENRGRRGVIRDPDVMPVTTCVSCFQAYEAVTKTCPYCGHVHEPESRSEPKFVDGDLVEFSEELLKQLRAAKDAIDSDFVPIPAHLKGTAAEAGRVRKHGEKQLAQSELREAIAWWAGVRRDQGMEDSEIYRRFFHTFNIDILSAQGLGAKDAVELKTRVTERYWT